MATTYAQRYIETRRAGWTVVPGEDVTVDGQTWFHPYGGQAPVRVA